jgi:beta-mannosidase
MPNEHVSLDGTWEVSHFDGYGTFLDDPSLPQALGNLRFLPAAVPGSVYLDLMRAGWLPDLYAGCNTLAARWVEQDYWYYRRTFSMPDLNGRRCQLVLDGLDLNAIVYLNNQLVGRHQNAYRPFRADITERLRPTDNELIIRVESGLLANADRRGGDYNLETTATLTKRAWLRKPHYACRWDWSPRLMNVGLTGGAALELCGPARLADVVIIPVLNDDLTRAELHVRAHVENLTKGPLPLTLTARLDAGGDPVTTTAEVRPGEAALTAILPVDQPRLWWPRGHGDQPRYGLTVTLATPDETLAERKLRTGIRRITLRQDRARDRGRLFQLLVNDRPIFCKGGNWVPAHLVYPQTTAADHAELVDLAAECGCNLLRIWGGGLYADHSLLDACDAAGILVWHDFMFACSKFPGDDADFAREAQAEVRHQLRRLANHPSLAIWCGNNEVQLGIRDFWLRSYDAGSRPDEDLFHRRFAELAAAEDPSRPYWPSSPWSPDGEHPNDRHTGDQHPWDVALGEPKGDYWHYRQDASRFPNEGGMLGPSTLKTLTEILPPDQREIGSRVWNHHDNPQNVWRGEPLLDHLLRINLCERPRALSFEDYVRYAGLLHGEALETGIDNWRRRKFNSAAAVFWMFNDTWPATVSWTPIDFYRRRKPAFWYVKRAFADLRAICVELDDELVVFVVNDTPDPRPVALRYGLFALAGGLPLDNNLDVTCPPNAAMVAGRFALSDWDDLGRAAHGAFAQLTEDGVTHPPQRLFRDRFKELAWTPAKIQLSQSADHLQLTSDQYAWGVCLDPDGETPLADNYLDLIPGLPRTVPWPATLPVPAAVHAANPTAAILAPPAD